jgi:hypothetical protein
MSSKYESVLPAISRKPKTQKLESSDTQNVKNGPGRPKAKHSDKQNYVQMSLYIRKDVRNQTKARLFEQGGEFSALVEGMLVEWLAKQGRKA